MRLPRRRLAVTKPRRASGRVGLPPPTASEAAFERILAALSEGTDEVVIERSRSAVVAEAAPVSERDAAPAAEAAAVLDELFAHRKEYLQADRFATIGEASNFFTKVVGVSFEGRQDIVAGLRGNETVELVRQPDNEHDPMAIEVRYGMLQLGFLRREIARRVAPKMDAGDRYVAEVSGVTGGRDGRHVGVNLYVRRLRGSAPAPAREERVAGNADGEALRVALIGERPIRDAQTLVLERVRAGANTLAVMGTGRGKSFCFQLPAAERALERRSKTLVFYPLRALANDQFDVLARKLSPFGLRVLRANGAIDDDERAELEEALETGEWDVILSTPEFAEYHREAFTRTWNLPSLVVVDEAHHVFDSRHRPAYGTLGTFIDGLQRPQVLALTATASDAAFPHVRRALHIERWVIDPTVRENLHVVDARGRADAEKLRYIAGAVCDDEKAIVYCNSRAEATKIAERLRGSHGGEVAFYHAQVPREKRVAVEDLFRAGGVQIVAATSAFGEGIDLPDVRHVFLYHLNFNFTEFNQQAGRAGRDGLDAQIHLLYGEGDRRINDYIIAQDAPSIGTLRELYRGMKGLAGADGLRMTYEDIARTLDLDMVRAEAVSRAVRTFEEAGLVLSGRDDDGRFVRFLETAGKVDLTKTSSFAEGEAIRESFERFCALALKADAATLEAIINRPIYPDSVPLLQ